MSGSKVETATPIASFKLRGALNHLLVAQSQAPVKSAVTSSTGNHGQGVAYAARLLGVPADIFLPDGCPIVKQTMIKLFGATLHVGGVDIDDAKERARKFCTERGGSFVDDGESARLIEGAGTIGHEIGAALEMTSTTSSRPWAAVRSSPASPSASRARSRAPRSSP